MTTLILGLIWAIPAYLLHCVLHEASHALTVRVFGGQITEFRVLPCVRGGKFRWAYLAYRMPHTLTTFQQFNICISPLRIEYLWLFLMAGLGHFVPAPFNGILLAEMVASVVDMTTWHYGMLRNHEWTDGGITRRLFGQESERGMMAAFVMALFCFYAVVLVRIIQWL